MAPPDETRHFCAGMDSWLADDSVPVGFDPRFREYYIAIPNQIAVITMKFCPWCGAEFPPSLREEWFDRIFAMDLTGPEDPRVPEPMRSDAWWAAADSDSRTREQAENTIWPTPPADATRLTKSVHAPPNTV